MDGWGVPADGEERRCGLEVGGWKKYKTRTGNWEIFSWKEPNGGKGAFTCCKCTRAVLKKKAFTCGSCCGSCTGDVLEKILFL